LQLSSKVADNFILHLRRQEAGGKEFRSSGVQKFRRAGGRREGVQEFRSSGVQKFRKEG
jgi:hypothetical protein